MPTFAAYDGTELAYHVFGEGAPVVCLPGGPMQDSVYLGDLGGLSAHRQLIMLDLRGTGQSAIPDDTASYRCDRLIDDVEALREDEPWFPTAFAALEAIVAGEVTEDNWQAIAPFSYGRWDEAAQALRAAEDKQRSGEAAAVYGSEGAYDPAATRAALAVFEPPVLLLAGEADLGAPPRAIAEFARLFPNAKLVIQTGGGHFPWLDDADTFVATTAAF